MALLNSASDLWITEHDSTDEFGCELMHKISQRNQYPKNTMAFSRSDIHVQQMMKKFNEKVSKLHTQLLSQSHSLTHGESERRQRLIDNLNYRCTQMQDMIDNPDTAGRTALLGNQSHTTYGAGSSSSTISWNDNGDTNAARNLTADEMRSAQKMLLREQDKGLESLGEIITRQKFMAQGITTEIDLQNEIIDDIGDTMDQTTSRLTRNTRNIKTVGRKSDTCWYWVIIVLLFIGILVASFV